MSALPVSETPTEPSAPRCAHTGRQSRRRWSTPCLARVAVVLAMTSFAPPPADAAVADYVGKSIASVRVVVEGHEMTDEAVSRAILTRVGQPLSISVVRETITHLFSLGRFDDVQVDAAAEANGVALTYNLSPVHPVTKVEFTGMLGGPGVDVGQMRRVLTDRYGPTPPLGRNAELTQVVAGALNDRGYLHPDIKPRAVLFHDPDRATLVLMIDPGPRTLVGDIQIVGTPTLPKADVLRRLGLAAGVPYERRELDARIDRYLEDRRKAGYYEAKLAVMTMLVDDDRTVNLTLTAAPGLHVRVVFNGDQVPSQNRAELVPIARDGSADEDLLEDSTNRIEDFFRGQGYRDVKAPHKREEVGGELVVTFDVSRGPLYRVSRVEVSGNSSVPLTDFEGSLRLRDGQPFSDAKLDADVQTIETVYHRRGYVSARVQTSQQQAAGGSADGPVELIVRVAVTEGPKTLVESVRVQGGSVAEPTKGLGLQPSRPYSETQLVLDRDALQLQYMNLGYLNASVEANPNLSADRTKADPVFTVREGPRVFVEHVLIVGNVRTKSDTIEREIQVKSGDPLSAEAKIESQRRLMALGLFRRVQISELRTGDESTRDLLVTVEESPATTIIYGGGVEGRVRVVRSEQNPDSATETFEVAPRGSFQIGQRNFFGKNRSANLYASASLHPQDSPFFAGQPNNNNDTGGFGFTEYRVLGQMREPRIFDTTADVLVVGMLEQQIRSSFNFARKTLSGEVARKFTDHISGSASYQLERDRIFDFSTSELPLIDRVFPQVLLSSVSASVIETTLDDPIEPGRGYYTSGNIQLAARAIGSEVGFIKEYTRFSAFHTLPRARNIVLAGNAQLGLATGFTRDVVDPTTGEVIFVDDLPASERFFAGGDTTVRGFALDTVGIPGQTLDSDGFPLGGNALVVFKTEVRAPIRSGVGVVGFFDTGQVFASVADIDLTQLRSAVGFGLRYRSPVGPIRVDLGFKIHPQIIGGHREGLTALHVSFGQAF
jgi:outer membrane protein assembly complex protein YaeT